MEENGAECQECSGPNQPEIRLAGSPQALNATRSHRKTALLSIQRESLALERSRQVQIAQSYHSGSLHEFASRC